MTDWKDFEWVVWRLEVQDPSRLAGEDPGLDERTKESMTELAASLGCVYEYCVDYDKGAPCACAGRFVVSVVGSHPVRHRPRQSRAVAAQGVKVVRTVARSTLTP
ncbi:hypothetical protein ABZT43_47355 [Streptomyces sp. NPDC005349]|uniref:hypothetical protein n=1 Tax=Streptomyces sp. NPDC005349 TaxID=3157037 RepID=UPI0033BB113E